MSTHTHDTIGCCLWCSRLIEKVPSVLVLESLIRRVRQSQGLHLLLLCVLVAGLLIFISVFSANELSFKCATMFCTDCSCCFSCTLSVVKERSRRGWVGSDGGRKGEGVSPVTKATKMCSEFCSVFRFCFVLIAVGEHNLLQRSEAKVLYLLYDFSVGDFCCSSGRGTMTKRRERARSDEKKKENKTLTSTLTHSPKVNWKYTNVRLHVWALPDLVRSPLSLPHCCSPYPKLLYFCTHNSSLFTVNCVQIYFACTHCVYLFHFMCNFSLCASGQKLCMSTESFCSVPASRYHSRDPVVSCRVLLCCCWQLQFNWVITPTPGTASDKLMARCELPTHIPYG